MLILATIMIPFQSIVTPIFLILSTLGLQNSLVGLVLVYVTLQLPFSVFMMRNSFDAVPKEIEEAARMDGASSLQLLVLTLLPLVWPGVVTVGLFAFLNSWNEFFGALVLLTDQRKFTLPIMVAAVQSGTLRRHRLGRRPGGRHRHDDPLPDPCSCFSSASTSAA